VHATIVAHTAISVHIILKTYSRRHTHFACCNTRRGIWQVTWPPITWYKTARTTIIMVYSSKTRPIRCMRTSCNQCTFLLPAFFFAIRSILIEPVLFDPPVSKTFRNCAYSSDPNTTRYSQSGSGGSPQSESSESYGMPKCAIFWLKSGKYVRGFKRSNGQFNYINPQNADLFFDGGWRSSFWGEAYPIKHVHQTGPRAPQGSIENLSEKNVSVKWGNEAVTNPGNDGSDHVPFESLTRWKYFSYISAKNNVFI